MAVVKAKEFVARYVGSRKAEEILQHPLFQTTHAKVVYNRRELFLTAVLHSLLLEANKMGIPIGVVGGMGTTHLYGRAGAPGHSRRRYARNIDVEIPAGHNFAKLFERMGLARPMRLKEVYLPHCWLSSTPYQDEIKTETEAQHSEGKIDVYIINRIPRRTFKECSRKQIYRNHITHETGLPGFEHRQLTPEYILGTKLQALADPNRALTIGKMDDLHDLINLLGTVPKKQLRRALRKSAASKKVEKKTRANLKTFLELIEAHYEVYDKWADKNLFALEGKITPVEWSKGIAMIMEKMGIDQSVPHSPVMAIRTKIQLLPRGIVKQVANALKSGSSETRSGLLSRQVQEFLEANKTQHEVNALSRLHPLALASAIIHVTKQSQQR